VWQHEQGVVAVLVTNSMQVYQGIFQGNSFVNRLRFDRIMAMSLWPHFFCRLRVACAWCGLIIMKFICLNGSTSKEYNIQSIQYALENKNTRNVITIIKKENKKMKVNVIVVKVVFPKAFFLSLFSPRWHSLSFF